MNSATFLASLTKAELLHMYNLAVRALAVAPEKVRAAAERQLPVIKLEMKRRGIK